jgi:hypothetical protein
MKVMPVGQDIGLPASPLLFFCPVEGRKKQLGFIASQGLAPLSLIG